MVLKIFKDFPLTAKKAVSYRFLVTMSENGCHHKLRPLNKKQVGLHKFLASRALAGIVVQFIAVSDSTSKNIAAAWLNMNLSHLPAKAGKQDAQEYSCRVNICHYECNTEFFYATNYSVHQINFQIKRIYIGLNVFSSLR